MKGGKHLASRKHKNMCSRRRHLASRKHKNMCSGGRNFKQIVSIIVFLVMALALIPTWTAEAGGAGGGYTNEFNSNCIYLDTRSMSVKYDYSFTIYDNVRLYSTKNGFRAKSGITEIGGVKYLYWESLNDDDSFFFTYGENWGIMDNIDYTRTDVIDLSISEAKGNVFYWDSVSMTKIRASNNQVKEQYVLNKKEVYTETLENVNSNYIYLDATDMIETANWASAGRNNVVLYTASDGKIYSPTGIGKRDGRYYIYWNAQNYNLSTGIIFLYKGKYGSTDDAWTIKNNKEFCRTEYVNGNTDFIKDNSNNTGIKGRIFYPIVNASGFDDNNKINEKENKYTYILGTRIEFNNTSTISKGDESQDIPTGTFNQDNNFYYVNSTIYDYYSDYELMAGKNRSEITRGENFQSGQNRKDIRYYNTLYMPERIFDSALSDYYKENSVENPIYFGHFQSKHSEPGTLYHNIATELNLYGYSSELTDTAYETKSNINNFYYDNNSEWRTGCKSCVIDKYDTVAHETSAAVQGLVNNTLTNNNLTIGSNKVEAPYFSESFLRGDNSKGVSLGNLYKNVAFPFILNNDGFWEFDSADSSQTLRLKQDSSTSQYYMDRVGAENAVAGFTNDAPTIVYNYFPLNDKEESGNPYKLNYGFGTRFDIKFTLTEDGRVTLNGKEQDIEFNFSGDDDVWVFVDGNLALDIGGGHGAVTGKINFSGTSQTKTATVSAVKTSTGTEYDKTTTFDLVGSNTKEHKLTMFYMERGLWESNMKITFNFPKNNNFEVEKKVEIPEVDSIFDDAMENLKNKNFDFSIKNLATDNIEYTGKVDTTEKQKVFNDYKSSDKDSTITTAYDAKANITNKDGRNVISWYAKGEKKDTDGQDITDRRIVKITPTNSSGKQEYLDLSNVSDYLSFETYQDSSENGTDPFIALVDSDGTRIGEWISKTPYQDNSNTMGSKVWRTMKVDLNTLKTKTLDSGSVSGFDFSKVKEIQFAYWNDVAVYVSPFTFNKETAVTGNEDGFTTNPSSIKDYGSVTSKVLEPANGAIYSISGKDGYKEVSNGTFALKDGEVAVFKNQFRKGSYISVSETGVDPNVFETIWTIYDEGKEVLKTDLERETSNVKQTQNKESVTKVSGFHIGDGRLIKNAVSGINQPDNSIAFYRYDLPDNENISTNLRASYTNKLKTGALTIKKSMAEGDTPDKEYKFKVTFTNVAGMGLEGNTTLEKTFSLNPSHSATDSVPNEITISGIPAGTAYVVQEIKENGDEFILKEVTQIPSSEDTIIDLADYTVSGTIVANEDKNLEFKNIEFPTIEIKGRKSWEVNEEETNKPTEITIRLERKVKGEDDSTFERAKDKDGNDIKDKVVSISDNWEYIYLGLPKYVDYTKDPKVEYEYRVIEVKVGDKDVDNSGYKPSYDTDENGNMNIINTRVGSITIKKVDENNEALKGAKFKLEKKNSDGQTWTEIEVLDMTNLSEGKFENLEMGDYRITEIKAPNGYNILKEPIEVTLPYAYNAGSIVNGVVVDSSGTAMDITFTVTNIKYHILPSMGDIGILGYIFIGFSVIAISFGMYIIYKKKKENLLK